MGYSWDKYWRGYRKSKAEQFLIELRHSVLSALIKDGDSVLEVGCGAASNIKMLAMERDIEAHACDSSPVAIRNLPKDITGKVGDCRYLSIIYGIDNEKIQPDIQRRAHRAPHAGRSVHSGNEKSPCR